MKKVLLIYSSSEQIIQGVNAINEMYEKEEDIFIKIKKYEKSSSPLHWKNLISLHEYDAILHLQNKTKP